MLYHWAISPLVVQPSCHSACNCWKKARKLVKTVCQKWDSNPCPQRGPEVSSLPPIREQGFTLESGALDHSAILTCCVSWCATLFGWRDGKTPRCKTISSHLGIEPRTFGLEVQRAILCANGTCLRADSFLYELTGQNKAQGKVFLAERSFDLRTSGLWAQHASAAPLCCASCKQF